MQNRFYALLLALVSFGSVAGVVATPENEEICQSKYVKAVFAQQVQYSNSQNSPQVRRTAERHIDRSREVYSETNSFCSALNYLDNDASDELQDDFIKAKEGESQYQ
jgi:3'-phosphoadenosine 5'-phosphosulfate (PAPS) 3'-phosphatase